MTQQELDQFLEENPHIEWLDHEEGQQLCFRNTRLAWYQNNPAAATAVEYRKMEEISPAQLLQEINRGLEVEGMTRITGYYTKVASWNPGKRGELKDRKKFSL